MSTLVTNTITGLSTAANITIGSTPVVSASANSLTIRGEGSAQTSIQQGLAKSWINFNGTGTIAARDSFNHSSLTDVSAGNHTVTMASAMGNVNYSFTGGVAESNASSASRVVNFGSNFDSGTLDPNFTTTAYSVNTFFCNSDGQEFDVTFISNQIFGDLA
jgi:hypothetical protein